MRTRHSSSVYANALRPAWLVASRVCRRSPAARRFICGDADPPRRKSAPQKIEAEIADLERRLTCQLVNLEADEVTAALRRAGSVSASPSWRTRSPNGARESATEAPTSADVAPLSTACRSADRLAEAPQGELRALFDALQLDVVYQPAEGAVDVAPHPCDTLIFLTKRFVVAAAMALWFDRPAAHPRGWCRGHRHRRGIHLSGLQARMPPRTL